MNRFKARRGSQCSHAKLNEEQVREIFAIVKRRDELKAEIATMRNKDIAAKYGVHVRTIDHITAFLSWTHVTEE